MIGQSNNQLNIVAYLQELVPLKIFEIRYLDMVRSCYRNETTFGIIAAYPHDLSNEKNNLPFARVGTSVSIIEAYVTHSGIIMICCFWPAAISG